MDTNPFNAKFDNTVHNALERWHIPGIAVAVVSGENTWSKAYGVAQVEPREDVKTNTLFYTASTTKAQLCAAWGIYISSEQNQKKPEQERITWTTPLADIIGEDFVLQDPVVTRQITLEDAVSHRTGMARHELAYGKKGSTTLKGVTRNLRNLPLHNTLRTHFEYCNIMYIAATYALEVVTGKDLSQILHEYLWKPFGMEQTYAGYGPAATAVKTNGEILAKGYRWTQLPGDPEENEGHLVEEAYMDFPEVSGAGYVISTANDYSKWMRCLLSASFPLIKHIVQELWTPRSLVPPSDSDCIPFDGGILTYALGWFVGSYKGYKAIWHPGGLHGAGSMILLVPELRWGVTYFANGHDSGPKLRGLAFALMDAMLCLPEEQQTGMKKVDDVVLASFKKAAANFADTRQRLLPSAPASSGIPLTLPFENYSGTYSNVGYGDVTFIVDSTVPGDKTLYCQWERCWPTKFYLHHVSAESWLLVRKLPSSPLRTTMKAESKIGADGRVQGLYMAMEPTMLKTLMWFERKT